VGVSDGTIRKRVAVISYTLSIVTVELSLTIQSQFAIKSLRHLSQQGLVTLEQIRDPYTLRA